MDDVRAGRRADVGDAQDDDASCGHVEPGRLRVGSVFTTTIRGGRRLVRQRHDGDAVPQYPAVPAGLSDRVTVSGVKWLLDGTRLERCAAVRAPRRLRRFETHSADQTAARASPHGHGHSWSPTACARAPVHSDNILPISAVCRHPASAIYSAGGFVRACCLVLSSLTRHG